MPAVRQNYGAAMRFGSQLVRAREAAGLTQRELAARTGESSTGRRVLGRALTENNIAKLERNFCAPSWTTAVILAESLGLPLDTFRPDPAVAGAAAKRGRPRKPVAPAMPRRPVGRPRKAVL